MMGEKKIMRCTDCGMSYAQGDLHWCPHVYSTAKENKADHVDHPQHYARWKMEPIEFIAINDLPWWLHSIIKYIMRYDAKDGLKDLYKARAFLEMKIRQLEGEKRFWDKPVSVERRANRG